MDRALKHNDKIIKGLIFTFALFFCLLFFVPVYGALTTAFRLNRDIVHEGFWSLPLPPVIDNFIAIFKNGKIFLFLRNTVIVTLMATLFSIGLGCLSGYAFAKLSFKRSNILYMLIIAGMFFPPQVVLIRLFKLFDGIGLIDTLAALIIVHVAFGLPICTLMMTNFFKTVPTSLRYSAMIDGAGEWRVLAQIMMPLTKPALTALCILQFTWIWNDFLWPLILIKSENFMTIQMGVMQLRGQFGLAWGTQAAACLIATIPTLAIFLFFQRHFIRGLIAGAVKE